MGQLSPHATTTKLACLNEREVRVPQLQIPRATTREKPACHDKEPMPQWKIPHATTKTRCSQKEKTERKKLILREENCKNNLGTRTVDKVKEEGWSSRSSGLMMQSQNQGPKAKERTKPTRAEPPGVNRGSSIHRQQDPLPMALAAIGNCALQADISALSSGLGQLQDKHRLWPHLWKPPTVNEPAAILGVNSVKRLSHRGLEEEKAWTWVPQGSQGTSFLEPSWDPCLRLPRPSGRNWRDQSSNRVLEVEAEHGNLRECSASANLY